MKNEIIQKFESAQMELLSQARGKKFPDFNVGDTVNVKYKITEGATTRLQSFIGVVIARAKKPGNYSATFTVRKISSNIGVERKFVFNSPLLSDIEVVKRGIVRRAKLYYLRKLSGKSSRIEEDLSEKLS